MSSNVEELKTDPSLPRQDALAPGDALLGGQYRIEKYLASGGFGITYLAFDSLDRKVVIKECYPEVFCCRDGQSVKVRNASMQTEFLTIVRHFDREARRLAKLTHPNIVGVHQVFFDNGTAYMALDHVEGCDLMKIIEDERIQLRPEEIKAMLIRLLEAVGYMHDHKVLHRDISPDNILVDKTGKPVLIDFGAAYEEPTHSSRKLSTLRVVKDGYSPQESYLDGIVQTMSSDLYSIAATFYHLITGEAPPNSPMRLAALASNRPDPYVPIPPRGSGYDHFFLGAIDQALAVFPEERPQTAQEWIELIEEKRRREALKIKAQRDKQVELDIKLLAEETNRAIVKDKPVASPPKPRRIDGPKRPTPAPRKPAAPVSPARPLPADLPDLSALRPRSNLSLLGRILSKPGALLRSKPPEASKFGRKGA